METPQSNPTPKPPKSNPAPKPAKPGWRERFRLFAQTVVRSCYDMEFYRQVRTERWNRGLVYFFKLMLLITLVTAMFLAPTILSGLGQLREYVDNRLPAGATVSIDQGQLETNLPQPMNVGSKDEPIIVDTSVTGMDFPRDRLEESGLLIGRDALFMRQAGTEERAYALKEFPDFSIDKKGALGWLERAVVPTTIVLTLLLSLFYFLGVSIGNLLFVLLGAALTQLFARLWRVRLEFGQTLAMGLYAVTLPLAVGALFDAMGWHQVPVFPVVFFMIMAWAVADERTRQSGLPAVPGAPSNERPPLDKGPAGESEKEPEKSGENEKDEESDK